MKKKILGIVLSVAILCVAIIGGTIAYLTSTPDSKSNTFTIGKVEIALTAISEGEIEIKPGSSIESQAKVTVNEGSEACYLFVKIDEDMGAITSGTFADYISYTLTDDWTKLEGANGIVYYTILANKTATTTDIAVFDGNITFGTSAFTLEVNRELNAEGAEKPSIALTAYAIQKDGIADVQTAASEFGLYTLD